MSSTDPTALWICHGISMVFCLVRPVLRKVRYQDFTAGDYWTMAALVAITLRATLLTIIFRDGYTTTLDDDLRPPGVLDQSKRDRITLNSKLYIVNRLTVNTLLWCLKMVVFDLCGRLINKTHKEKPVKYSFYTVFAATYLAAQLSVFLECRPFRLYWQLYPNPGSCVEGNVWLITYEVGNLITDTMLVVLPFPVLLTVKTRWRKKLSLYLLFSIGFFLIAVSIVRIVQGIPSARVQSTRTLWGSIETVFASFVAQAPTIYTLLRPDIQHSSYTPDTYRLTSFANRVSRLHSGSHPNYQGNDTEKNFNFDKNESAFRTKVYAGAAKNENTVDSDGESDSTKGIIVTVDVTQVLGTDSNSAMSATEDNKHP